ncbi:MAG: Gfo/Idh/MocA family oxidoreductase [Blastocatellales bacterium]|nr:Gfo/Idh/MocA family oxidoreductase [Blastocatellales bacterium]
MTIAKRVRWGLIGCGDISRKRVAPALIAAEHSQLIAVSRARTELADAFAREFGAERAYADWRDLIADPEIDAVYLATPVNLHAEQAIAAAAAGKHVLCEKPMAIAAADCDRMIAACDASGVKLGVAYYRRFYPAIRRMKEILASGEIGKPVLVEANSFERFNPAPGEDRAWLLDPTQSGGGPMMDFGCHRIEIMLNLFGAVSVTRSVTARALFDRKVEDTAIAVLAFTCGAQGVLKVTHAVRESQDTFDIYGSEGAIRAPVLNEGTLHIKTSQGVRIENHPPHANLHQPLIEDFIAAVTDDRAPEVDGAAGRAVQRVLEDVYWN